MLESGSVSYERATPYLPLIELLKAYLRIQERDDQQEMRERVAAKLLTLDRPLAPLLTPLLALLDAPVDDDAWGVLDPPRRRQRILDAVKRLLLRESQVQPLLLLFEDLHWIDSESQALLDGLIESLPTARVLLLVSYRPEYRHGWGSKTYYTQLRIDPLPPESAEELLTALLGQDESLETLKRVLIERTEGNPFFLVETNSRILEYTFKHALTHEVAYGSVLQDRRRALHARIVEAVEALYPDRLAEQVERLAHHAFRGEVWEKAVTYLRQADAKALAHSAYREAVSCFEQALAALPPLPDTHEQVERAIDLRLDLRQSLFPLNELATVWRYLQEAEGLARTLDDPRRLGWVSAYMSDHHVHTGGHVTEVRTLAQRVESIGERLADAPLQIAAQLLPCRGLLPLMRLSRDRTSLPAADTIATRPTDP